MVTPYRFIDLFRALAAYWVLVAHCFIWGGWMPAGLPNPKIAVDLFMMISGYLMVANADARASVEPLAAGSNRLRFWLRRYFRIAPAYYLSLAFAVAGGSHFLAGLEYLQMLDPSHWPAGGVYDPATTRYDAWNILLHLSFLFGLSPSYSFSTFLPDWSLSLEMQFYLAFPFLYLLMRRGGFFGVGVALSLACFAAGVVIQKQARFDEPSLLIFKLNYFVAGMLIHRFLAAQGWSRERVLTMAGAMICVCVEHRYGPQLLLLPLLAGSMLALGWLETHGRTPRRLKKLMDSRALTFASETSYSVYLFHAFFISAAGWLIHSNPALQALTAPQRVLAMIAFVSCGAYAFASLVFRIVETPCIEAGKDIADRLSPARPVAVDQLLGGSRRNSLADIP